MADEPKTPATPKSDPGPKVAVKTPPATDGAGTDPLVALAEAIAEPGELVRVRAVGSRPRRRADRTFDHVEGTILDIGTVTPAEARAIRDDPMLHVTPHVAEADAGRA